MFFHQSRTQRYKKIIYLEIFLQQFHLITSIRATADSCFPAQKFFTISMTTSSQNLYTLLKSIGRMPSSHPHTPDCFYFKLN